jgi:hypothetical protein
VILKSRTLSRTSDITETRNLCVIKVILLACFTYIDIFLFIKSLLVFTKHQIFFIHQYVQPCLSKNPKYTLYTIKSSLTLAYWQWSSSDSAVLFELDSYQLRSAHYPPLELKQMSTNAYFFHLSADFILSFYLWCVLGCFLCVLWCFGVNLWTALIIMYWKWHIKKKSKKSRSGRAGFFFSFQKKKKSHMQ